MSTRKDDGLFYTPAWRLAQQVRRRQLSPVEVVRALLGRIEALNPRLHAFLTVDGERALAEARECEALMMQGDDLPPLLGVPVTIKDLVYTKGLRTTGGSRAYARHVPESDAIVVERLRQAGAIILGKTNTSELGMSATTDNLLGEDCRNPWDTTRTSGGSSGGAAAAVAAGMGPLGVGSDGGGSIRIPAAFCGVFGFKPTLGTIPAHGGFESMPRFSHLGPIARDVRDAALLLTVTAGYDARDGRSRRGKPVDYAKEMRGSLAGLRVAWSADLGYGVTDPGVLEAAFAAAQSFASLGCVVEEATPEIEEPFSHFGPVVCADAAKSLGHVLDEHGDALTRYARRTLERGREVSREEYARAMKGIERFRARMGEFFKRYDLLLTPATATTAFACGERPKEVGGQEVSALWGAFPYSVPFNVTGQPAASLPCGFSAEGLPIGLQVAGRIGEDALVLRACSAFEEVRPWGKRRTSMT